MDLPLQGAIFYRMINLPADEYRALGQVAPS